MRNRFKYRYRQYSGATRQCSGGKRNGPMYEILEQSLNNAKRRNRGFLPKRLRHRFTNQQIRRLPQEVQRHLSQRLLCRRKGGSGKRLSATHQSFSGQPRESRKDFGLLGRSGSGSNRHWQTQRFEVANRTNREQSNQEHCSRTRTQSGRTEGVSLCGPPLQARGKNPNQVRRITRENAPSRYHGVGALPNAAHDGQSSVSPSPPFILRLAGCCVKVVPRRVLKSECDNCPLSIYQELKVCIHCKEPPRILLGVPNKTGTGLYSPFSRIGSSQPPKARRNNTAAADSLRGESIRQGTPAPKRNPTRQYSVKRLFKLFGCRILFVNFRKSSKVSGNSLYK